MVCTGSPARPGSRQVPRLAALALALVLGSVLWGLARAPTPPAAGSPDAVAATRDAIGAWEALWADVEARGVDALSPEKTDPSRRAAGDTAFMRYRNLWGPIDTPTRLAFQLAAISGEPARKRMLIEPLTQTETPLIRFRAHLELARLARRGGDFAKALASVHAALAEPDVPTRIRADAWFILGESALEQGRLQEAESALTTAIAADPGFWDARRLRLEVLAHLLARPRQSDAQCLDHTRRMIEDLGALPTLAEDQTQFRDLADRFAREDTPRQVAFVLIAGLGYHWSGAHEISQNVLKSAEHWRGRLPAGCERLILERIAVLERGP